MSEARAQLSMRFMHRKRSRAGVLDTLLDCYEADVAKEEMSLRTWLAHHYDPARVVAAFDRSRGRA